MKTFNLILFLSNSIQKDVFDVTDSSDLLKQPAISIKTNADKDAATKN